MGEVSTPPRALPYTCRCAQQVSEKRRWRRLAENLNTPITGSLSSAKISSSLKQACTGNSPSSHGTDCASPLQREQPWWIARESRQLSTVTLQGWQTPCAPKAVYMSLRPCHNADLKSTCLIRPSSKSNFS